MAAEREVLFSMIRDNVHANMAALRNYSGPLSQRNPSYFIEMCQAVGYGIADGSPVVQLKSADKGKGGKPAIKGIGTGVGIMVDRAWFNENLYTEIRAAVQATFGRTLHDPWFPSKGNSGEFLHAFTKGVSDAVADHYATAYNLLGEHPLVYKGVGLVKKGMYSGLVAPNIEGLILSFGPRMKGKFWPIICKVVAKVYVDAIHQNSTGTLTINGECIASIIPLQVCELNKTGFGIGTAI